jgi:hypothetical protein
MRFVSASPDFRLTNDGTNLVLSPGSGGWFVAKITGSFTAASNTYYTWAEQEPKEDGTGYRAIPNGKTGTSTANWAREINGTTSVATNTIVLMRPVIVTKAGGAGKTQLHEFAVGGGGGGASVSQTVVTAVTCSNGSLTVTTKTITVPGMVVT